MKIFNYLLLFTLFYSCVAGDVGGDKSGKSSSGANGANDPRISASSPSMSLPQTMTVLVTNPSIPFLATVSNPGASSFYTSWWINGVEQVSSGPFTQGATSYNVDPGILGVSSNTVQVLIHDNLNNVYDSISWNLNIVSVDYSGLIITQNSNAHTSLHARSNVDYISGGFSFDGSANSRGTIMSLTGFGNNEDFCIKRFGAGPGNPNDYKVVFLNAADSAISTPLPVGISFNAVTDDACFFRDSLLTFKFTGVARSEKIKAVIYDVTDPLSPILLGDAQHRKEWNIQVEDFNSSPIISFASGNLPIPPQVNATATTSQDVPFSFVFTVADKDQDFNQDADFDVSFTINSAPIDGATVMPATAVATPDCIRARGSNEVAIALKYECSIVFPSYGLAGNISSLTSYVIQASVIDSDGRPSNTLTWNVTPSEVNTPPTTALPTHAGAGGGTTDVTGNETTSTYVFIDGSPSTAVASAIENTTNLRIRALINDSQRDDYDVIFSYQKLTAPAGYQDFQTVNFSKSSNTLSDQIESNAFKIPESALAAASAATGTINLRITVIGKPDTGIPDPPVITDIDLLVSQSNENPTFTGGQSPLVGGAYNVAEGMPFTMELTAPLPTDGSDATDGGKTIAYQWELDLDCNAAWTPIAGATSSSLKWTPDIPTDIADGQVACFRVCIGDKGYANPANCTSVSPLPAAQTALTGGHWTGGITVSESDKTNVVGSAGKIFSLMNGDDLITLTHVNGDFTVTKRTYDPTTGALSAALSSPLLGSDQGSITNEVPNNISMTTDGTKLFIAYLIDEEDGFVTATSVFRVMVVDISAAPTYNTTFTKNIVSNSIGAISIHATDWFVPFVDFNNSNNISVIKKPIAHINNGANPIVPAEIINSVLNVTSYAEISSVYDSANSNLIVGLTGPVNEYDLMTIDISAGVPVSTGLNSMNIFNSRPVTSFELAGPNATNPNVFASGVDGGKFVTYYEQSDLTGVGAFRDSISTGVGQLTANIFSYKTESSDQAGELLVATRHLDSNIHLFKVDAVNETVKKNTKSINSAPTTVASVGPNQIALILKPNYLVGSVGATLNESTKSTAIVHYHDSSDSRASFVNIVDEANISGSTPFFQP